MDTTASEIIFNADGCNFCAEWLAYEKKRERETTNLPWVYHAMRRGGKYDCVVGLSGGVDSSTVLHCLIQNGIKPLCFSVDNGWNSKDADENIMRLVEGMKVPFERIVLDQEKFRKLQTAFIKAGVKNIEIPTDHVLMAVSYDMARKHGVKFIVGGGNHATEGIMPKSFGYDAKDLTHIKALFKKFVGEKMTGLPTISLFKYLYYRFILGIRVINLLDYYAYRREESIKLLKRNYGYKPYGMKHGESLFTAWFQNYYLPTKWGLDKRKPHLSCMILSGQMTRDEAIAELLKPLSYPKLEFEDAPRHEYSDYPNSEKLWKLLHKIYANRHLSERRVKKK